VNRIERDEATYGDDIFSHFRSMPGELGELPCIDKTMSPVILWTILPSFRKKLQRWKKKLKSKSVTIFSLKHRTHMCVKHLYLPKNWVEDGNMGSSLADKPITRSNI
jgi:hypothetical protein